MKNMERKSHAFILERSETICKEDKNQTKTKRKIMKKNRPTAEWTCTWSIRLRTTRNQIRGYAFFSRELRLVNFQFILRKQISCREWKRRVRTLWGISCRGVYKGKGTRVGNGLGSCLGNGQVEEETNCYHGNSWGCQFGTAKWNGLWVGL